MKPRFDCNLRSNADAFDFIPSAYRRPARASVHRFAVTRTGVVNPPPGPFSLAVTQTLLKFRRRLVALFGGRPKGVPR